MKNEIKVSANPNNVLSGEVGDLFFRIGETLYTIDAATNTLKIHYNPISKFIGQYGDVYYRTSAIVFKTPSETWRKNEGSGKTGWVFLAPSDPLSDATIVTQFATPTPSATPVPTPTATPVPTPTPTPEVVQYLIRSDNTDWQDYTASSYPAIDPVFGIGMGYTPASAFDGVLDSLLIWQEGGTLLGTIPLDVSFFSSSVVDVSNIIRFVPASSQVYFTVLISGSSGLCEIPTSVKSLTSSFNTVELTSSVTWNTGSNQVVTISGTQRNGTGSIDYYTENVSDSIISSDYLSGTATIELKNNITDIPTRYVLAVGSSYYPAPMLPPAWPAPTSTQYHRTWGTDVSASIYQLGSVDVWNISDVNIPTREMVASIPLTNYLDGTLAISGSELDITPLILWFGDNSNILFTTQIMDNETTEVPTNINTFSTGGLPVTTVSSFQLNTVGTFATLFDVVSGSDVGTENIGDYWSISNPFSSSAYISLSPSVSTPGNTPPLTQYLLTVDPSVANISSSFDSNGIGYYNNDADPATATLNFVEIWEVSGSLLFDSSGSKVWVDSSTLLGSVDLNVSGSTNVDITNFMLLKSPNTESAVVFVAIGNVSSGQYSLMTNVTTSLNTIAVNDNIRVGDVFVSPHSPDEIGVTNSTNTTFIRGDFTNHAVSFSSASLVSNQATFTLTGMYADPINLVLPFPNYTLDLAGATTFITGGIDSNGIGYSNFAGVASDMNMTFSNVLVNKATGSVVSPGVLDASAGYTGVGSINFGSIVDSSSIDITQFLLNNPFSDPQVLAVSFTADYSSVTYELFVDLFLVTSSIATFEPFEVDNITTPHAGTPINIVDALGNTTQSVNYSKNAVKIVNRVGHGSGSFIVSSPYNIHPLVLPSYTPEPPPS